MKKIIVGFDGFVDVLVKPIKEKGETTEYFDTIGNLGRYLVGQEGKSCSIEYDIFKRKHGGNAPLLSTAAAHLGMDTTCIGMMGYPSLDPVFAPLNFKKISYMPPGEATALEFNDGKVFLAPGLELKDPWERVNEAFAYEAEKAFQQADTIALVNWSEITFAKELWKNILNCLPDFNEKKEKHILFDLCDTTRKPKNEVDDILQLIGRFSKKGTTTLSLNENECLDVGKKIFDINDSKLIAKNIRSFFSIDEILVRSKRWVYIIAKDTECLKDTNHVEKPVISTGAGDNYNAAYCYGTAKGLTHEERIDFCNKFVHGYLSKGGY